MRLVIFDIDGTLTATFKTDEVCFVRALAEICGFTDVETDWSRYRHATDSGIFHELYMTRLGRPPSPDETGKFRDRFIDLLNQASSESAFLPIAGAPQLLSRLQCSTEYRVSLGTGAWRDCARLKMASAGLCYDDYPAASGDDFHDRQSIIKLSGQRAAERYGKIESTIYVGDGVWDARVSRDLGIPFIGIGNGTHATRLLAEGALQVFPDLSDGDAIFASLSETAQLNGRTESLA